MSKTAIRALINQEINIISLLPRGAMKEISERTGLDRNSIRLILQGVWNNQNVMTVVLEILQRNKSLTETAIQEIAAVKNHGN